MSRLISYIDSSNFCWQISRQGKIQATYGMFGKLTHETVNTHVIVQNWTEPVVSGIHESETAVLSSRQRIMIHVLIMI